MSDRDGVSPAGETPDRRPTEKPEASTPIMRAIPTEPTEPTLRVDPVVRELEMPFDTGELHTLPTGQLLIVHRPEFSAATSDVAEDRTQRRVYSWVAAVVGTLGAVASLFVGWMLPLSIAGIVFGILGLRREEEGRTLAFVGIGTGVAGLVFSAVWIGYYAIVFGALPH